MSTLADLRQANLREQKSHDSSVPPPTSETPPAAETPPVETFSPAVSDDSPPTLALVIETAELDVTDLDGDFVSSEAFLERVRARQSRKVMYPAGVKVTSDMNPTLFARAKRYCHDHGNVTLRQTLLDLLDEYLDEEGY